MHRFDLATLVAILSIVLIAAGCAMVYLPAGLIIGGALCLAGAIAHERGRTPAATSSREAS
jgi:hypothetical protein